MGKSSTQSQKGRANMSRTTKTRVTDLADFTPQFGAGLSGLTGALNSKIANPNLQYGKPFSDTWDPLVNYGYSRGLEGLMGHQNADNAALANNLNLAGTGENSALLQALISQNSRNTALSGNALIPQAWEAQRGFDVTRNDIQNQQNQTRLGLFNAQNTARSNDIAARNQNMSTLGQLLAARAGSVTTDKGRSSFSQTGKTEKPWYSK